MFWGSPGTYVPGYHIPPLRGWSSAFLFGSRHDSKSCPSRLCLRPIVRHARQRKSKAADRSVRFTRTHFSREVRARNGAPDDFPFWELAPFFCFNFIAFDFSFLSN
jgi:hypothetical protein